VMSGDEIVAVQESVVNTRIDPAILDYILDLTEATRNDDQLHLGVSPRGALALTQASQSSAVVDGRDYVTPDDVKTLFIACCAHRVVSKTYLHNGDAAATSRILQAILDKVPAPR
jgi:MoxR-like ATPase